MIAKLTGLLDSIGDDWAVIDVGGIGYLVFCSARSLAQMPGKGEAVSFVIETHIREDHIHLYGFLDQAEREWFRLLTTVQGVGAKVGLGILSVLAPQELSDAIQRALTMPLAERRQRWSALMQVVRDTNVSTWRDAYVSALRQVEIDPAGTAAPGGPGSGRTRV